MSDRLSSGMKNSKQNKTKTFRLGQHILTNETLQFLREVKTLSN